MHRIERFEKGTHLVEFSGPDGDITCRHIFVLKETSTFVHYNMTWFKLEKSMTEVHNYKRSFLSKSQFNCLFNLVPSDSSTFHDVKGLAFPTYE